MQNVSKKKTVQSCNYRDKKVGMGKEEEWKKGGGLNRINQAHYLAFQ